MGPYPVEQTKWASLIEAKVNLIVSYPMTWAIYVYVIPWIFHVQLSHKEAGGFLVLFSVSSLIRQFLIRRIFVWVARRKRA